MSNPISFASPVRRPRILSRKGRLIACTLASALIASCATPQKQASRQLIDSLKASTSSELPALKGLSASLPDSKQFNVTRKLAAEGIRNLEAGELEKASKLFNMALELEPTNPNVQLLNGLTYHLIGLRGDSASLDLAKEGYQIAIQYDPSNWIGHYQLGLLHMDRRNYAAAKERFAEALLVKPDNPELLYNMVCASYYSQDPQSAAAALTNLEQLEPEHPRTLRAGAMVSAALGAGSQAQEYMSRYAAQEQLEADRQQTGRLYERLREWNAFYDRGSRSLDHRDNPERFLHTADEKEKDETKSAKPAPAPAAAKGGEEMVIVDVVIVRSEEETRTHKGVNLLNGLELQFGEGTKTLGWSRSSTSETGSDTVTKITREIGLSALAYSLNIFNSTSKRNEVLARPTLVAQNGTESRFFSGINIRAAAVGEGDTKSKPLLIQDDIGVELKVTPQVVDNSKVQIFINASRTFLRTPSDDVDFQYRIETSKTNVEANVIMNFGETLILSGLSEKETEKIRTGVPGLQDIPLVQYLFSEEDTLDFQKSVLILLTPRKPEYVYQETASLPPEQRSEVLNELQARFSDWFKPYPNWASVFHHLQSNTLYREFRTGDVTLERWESQLSFQARLKSILDFLYF